ncbi:MAG: hypothetical protein ABW252_16820 [Polyangiales bacterium]
MSRLRDQVRDRFADLAEQPLFHTLAQAGRASRSLQILPHVTFWANVFQDVLVLNLQRIEDPTLKKIAEDHYLEDAGHNLWLADDLRLVNGRLPDVVELFDARTLRAREIAYAFMAEVYRAASDWERVALPVVLEEGGHLFLPALIDHFERLGVGRHLHALGRSHVVTEAAHDLHGEEVSALFDSLDVPDESRARATAMVERAHATFTRFAALLDEVIHESSSVEEERLQRRLQTLFDEAPHPTA